MACSESDVIYQFASTYHDVIYRVAGSKNDVIYKVAISNSDVIYKVVSSNGDECADPRLKSNCLSAWVLGRSGFVRIMSKRQNMQILDNSKPLRAMMSKTEVE